MDRRAINNANYHRLVSQRSNQPIATQGQRNPTTGRYAVNAPDGVVGYGVATGNTAPSNQPVPAIQDASGNYLILNEQVSQPGGGGGAIELSALGQGREESDRTEIDQQRQAFWFGNYQGAMRGQVWTARPEVQESIAWTLFSAYTVEGVSMWLPTLERSGLDLQFQATVIAATSNGYTFPDLGTPFLTLKAVGVVKLDRPLQIQTRALGDIKIIGSGYTPRINSYLMVVYKNDLIDTNYDPHYNVTVFYELPDPFSFTYYYSYPGGSSPDPPIALVEYNTLSLLPGEYLLTIEPDGFINFKDGSIHTIDMIFSRFIRQTFDPTVRDINAIP